jgi:hypothetical protein
MEKRTKLALNKDKMYKALGEGERTSKKVASIRMSDGSTFKRKNANQYGAAEGGNDYTEKRSNRSDRFDLGGTADSSNTGANMGGTMGSSVMKHGGGVGNDEKIIGHWLLNSPDGRKLLKKSKKAQGDNAPSYNGFNNLKQNVIDYILKSKATGASISSPYGNVDYKTIKKNIDWEYIFKNTKIIWNVGSLHVYSRHFNLVK